MNITMIANKTVPSKIDNVIKTMWTLYDYFHGSYKDYLLIILYAPTVLIGVIANIFVIIMVCKYHLKSVTYYFVINLSVADLLVAIICMPMTISQEISMSWNQSEFLCKLTSYLQSVSVTASIYTIMAMSIDRYLAIRNPMTLRCICSQRNIILVIITIWLASMTFLITIYGAMRLQNPMADVIEYWNKNVKSENFSTAIENFSRNATSSIPPDFNMCIEDLTSLGIRQDVFGNVYFLFCTVIPCLVVLLAYSMIGFTLWSKKPPFDYDNRESVSSRQGSRLRQDRKRVALMLLFLAILFAVCWLPYNIIKYLLDLGIFEPSTNNTLSNALKYFLFLGHANSALNPVVYCWMTRGFRQNFSRIFRCIYNRVSSRISSRVSNVSHHDPSRRNAMTITDDNMQHIPMYWRRLVRIRRIAILVRQHKRIGYLSNSDDKDIKLRNIYDVSNAQIDRPENNDKKDLQQSNDKSELETSRVGYYPTLETIQPKPSTLCTTDGQH